MQGKMLRETDHHGFTAKNKNRGEPPQGREHLNDANEIYEIGSHKTRTLDELLVRAGEDEDARRIYRALANPANLTYRDVAIEAKTTEGAVSTFVNRRKQKYMRNKFRARLAELIARRCGRMGTRLLG